MQNWMQQIIWYLLLHNFPLLLPRLCFCDRYYYYLFIYYWQKMYYIALDKANWSQPKIEIIYLYKNLNIIFFLYIDFLLKSENYHGGKLNKTHLVNICFAWLARAVLWDPSFYFCLKNFKWFNSFIFIRNKVP